MGALRLSVCLAVSIVSICCCNSAAAIDASNVLVLYNTASQDGYAIAQHYQAVHPGVTLLPLTVSTSEAISADEYLNTIYQPVHSALTSTTQVIVTTKGLPLRIQVGEPEPPAVWPNTPTYFDGNGVLRTISNWQPFSSLESELADIDKISTWQMMGDQSYALNQNTQFSSNPYYGATTSFSHATTGTRLTARLDGYTVPQINTAIDRAQNAFIGPVNSPNGPFHFIVDADPSHVDPSQAMTTLVNTVLGPTGMPLTYDNTAAFVGATTGPLIGYDSNGVHQGSTPANYITSGLNVTLANGAIFNSWESYNAVTFTTGAENYGQGQVAQWLQIGGTAGVGNVWEPTASISTVANEDKLFQMMLGGKTFAEAGWSSLRELSFVNTLIGDPLMTWKTLEYGDINKDGFVDMSDLSILGSHWGNRVASGGYGWGAGDINSDGVVDFSDLALMGAHWGQASSWSTGSANMGDFDTMPLGPAMQPFLHATPEPSTMSLLLAGAAALLACGRRWKRQRAT